MDIHNIHVYIYIYTSLFIYNIRQSTYAKHEKNSKMWTSTSSRDPWWISLNWFLVVLDWGAHGLHQFRFSEAVGDHPCPAWPWRSRSLWLLGAMKGMAKGMAKAWQIRCFCDICGLIPWACRRLYSHWEPLPPDWQRGSSGVRASKIEDL